jgi:hypothetical protein
MIYSAKFIKHLLCIICFLAVFFTITSCSAPPDPEKNYFEGRDSVFDVFLVAGQSNAYYGLGLDADLDKGMNGIYQLGRNDSVSMKIIRAEEPLQHYYVRRDRIGFALTFARLYMEELNPRNGVLLVPCAMSWTGFSDSSWRRGDCLYNDAVSRTNYVLKKYHGSKLKGILWHQGEKDVNYPLFQPDLDSMIIGLRKDIVGKNDSTPFILGGMVPHWIEDSKAKIAQQEILKNTAKRLPSVGYADPYVPFKIEKETDTTDAIHFSAEGQREMGKRYFEEFEKLSSPKNQ